MASIKVCSMEFASELHMAGFELYMEHGRMRARIEGFRHRELRSLAYKVWLRTLENHGFYTISRVNLGKNTIEHNIVPCFSLRSKIGNV